MTQGQSGGRLQVLDWIVDPSSDEISAAGRVVKLEPRLMRLLMCLAATPGEVVTTQRLLEEVWPDVIVGPASVYQSISQLRRLLEDKDTEPTYIATVPRKGYRLIAPVQQLQRPAPESSQGVAATPDLPAAGAWRRHRRLLATGAIGIALLLAGGLYFYIRATQTPTPPSIAVLPFIDMTASQPDQLLGDGLAEELSNYLAQLPTLRVVARTSSFQYRDQRQDARRIGRELGVSHVLEGSLRRSGNGVRVIAQLIDARSGFHVWSRTVEETAGDVMKIQEEIARSIAGALEIELTSATADRFKILRTQNVRAYQLYVLGKHYRAERKAEANTRAIALLEDAVAADPRFAPAIVELALATLNEYFFTGQPMTEIAARVEPLLARAQSIAPDLPEIYAVRGALRTEQLRLDEAVADLNRAIAMNPSLVLAYRVLGRTHGAQGELRDALDSYSHAAALDPRDFLLQAERCAALRDLARFDEALQACARATQLEQTEGVGLEQMAYLHFAMGKLDTVLEDCERAVRTLKTNDTLYELMAEVYLQLRMTERASAVYARARGFIDDADWLNTGAAEIALIAGGVPALQTALAAPELENAGRAMVLLRLAPLYLVKHDVATATKLKERALAADDFSPKMLYDTGQVHWATNAAIAVGQIELAAGDRRSGEERLAQLARVIDKVERSGQVSWGVSLLRAKIAAALGNPAEAVRQLTIAFDRGWRGIAWLATDPAFDAVRRSPGYATLAARVEAQLSTLRAQTESTVVVGQ